MRWAASLFLSVVLFASAARGMTQESNPKPDAAEFFSGTVMTISAVSITVHRKGLGSNATTKTFSIDPETKIEGKPRLRVTVTVQYSTAEDGACRAIHIIVR